MIPLGREEDQRLEFKGRDSLGKPSSLSREVVAMLNARGGEIWIGVGEEARRATRVEPIEAPERERARLWNHLIDSIEPPPLEEEIKLEEVLADEGTVLRIRVYPREERRPYAQLKEGGRFFVVRAGARVRSMTREEILRKSAPHGAEPNPAQLLRKERDKVLQAKTPTFWLRLQPSIDLGLDVRSEFVGQLLRDPTLSGNRPSGCTFASDGVMHTSRGRRVLQNGDEALTILEGSGALEHRIPMLWLGDPLSPVMEIHPLILLERITSLFRLAAALYRAQKMKGRTDSRVAADLAMVVAKGWTLRGYSPTDTRHMLRRDVGVLEHDLLLDRPLEFELEALIREPDACALRIIVQVYEAFGLDDPSMIPREFDQQRGRLVLGSG